MVTNRRTKIAILLNTLVLPGVGHIYTGFKVRGALLAITCTFFVIAPLVKYAFMMSYALNTMSPKGLNPLAVIPEAALTVWPHMRNALFLAMAGIIVVWGFGIIDIYLKSKAQNTKQIPNPKQVIDLKSQC